MSKYDYTLIRSKRRTFTIKVTEENRIVVRAPEYAAIRDIENVLFSKRDWIDKAIAFNKANALASDSVKNYQSAYVGGRLMPVRKDTRNFIDGTGVHVTGINGFRTAYVNSLGEEFMRKFFAAESAIGLKSASVGWRSYKSRWGCCDGRCNIIFNFKLLMLPAALQRYVIVHELCHILHHDHSPAFWAEVARFLPEWKKYRKDIKRYSFLVKLY